MVKKMIGVCFVFLIVLSVVSALEVQTEIVNVNNNNNNNNNNNKSSIENVKVVVDDKINGTFEVHPIRQPMQSHQIERTLSFGGDKSNKSDGNKQSQFRPSPHLETYFEFNKFPVVPAMPEAKHFNGFKKGDWGELPWLDKGAQNVPKTDQQPWVSRIKFPTTTTITNEHPYQFVTNDKAHSVIGSKTFGYPPKKSYELPLPKPSKNNYGGNGGRDYGNGLIVNGNIDKFEHNLGHKTHSYEYGVPEKVPTKEMSPWKKVIKLLATFIPIGLLISALTPSVITISPMNMSQARGRAEDLSKNRILTSLDYLHKLSAGGCEERILCELILSAGSSSDSEQHVDNLLKTFTEEENGFVESAEDLKKIFDAVKKQECSTLQCDDLQKEDTVDNK